jgi:hypothetical protein
MRSRRPPGRQRCRPTSRTSAATSGTSRGRLQLPTARLRARWWPTGCCRTPSAWSTQIAPTCCPSSRRRRPPLRPRPQQVRRPPRSPKRHMSRPLPPRRPQSKYNSMSTPPSFASPWKVRVLGHGPMYVCVYVYVLTHTHTHTHTHTNTHTHQG